MPCYHGHREPDWVVITLTYLTLDEWMGYGGGAAAMVQVKVLLLLASLALHRYVLSLSKQ